MKTMRHTIIGMFAFLILMAVITFGSAGIKVKAACSHKATGKWQITKNATCDSNGTKLMKCKKCKCVLQTVKIGKLGHNWGAYQTTVAPTCTSAGTQISRCTRCVATRPATIPATGHNASGSYIETKKATCTKKGTQVRKCTKCSVNLETKSIPVLGHKYSSYKTIKKSTCTTDGKQTRTCQRSGCNKKDTAVIKRTGHKASSKYVVTKQATCDSYGTKVKKCTKCSVILDKKNILPTGHNASSSYIVTKAATCTVAGTSVRNCTKCSKVLETKTLKPLNHSWGKYIITKQPTCTDKGRLSRRCTRCPQTQIDEMQPTGHKYGQWNIDYDSTYKTTGWKHRSCQINPNHVEYHVVPLKKSSSNADSKMLSIGLEELKQCFNGKLYAYGKSSGSNTYEKRNYINYLKVLQDVVSGNETVGVMEVEAKEITAFKKYGSVALKLGDKAIKTAIPVLGLCDTLANVAEFGLVCTDDSCWYLDAKTTVPQKSCYKFGMNLTTEKWGKFWSSATNSTGVKVLDYATQAFVALGGIPYFEENDDRLKDQVGDKVMIIKIYTNRKMYEESGFRETGNYAYVEMHFDKDRNLKRFSVYDNI